MNASGGGDPKYFMVGLPDNAVKESWHRIETALKNSYFRMPRLKIVINLAPADVRKEGSAFDLPMAVGILAATEQIEKEEVDKYIIMGELSLDGTIQPIKGLCPLLSRHGKKVSRDSFCQNKTPGKQPLLTSWMFMA